jgi:hypothetical protein
LLGFKMFFTCFPPASGQSPSAFLTVQLQRLEARDICQAIQKGKDSLFGCPVLCLSPLSEPPPLFLCPAPGLRGTCHKPNHPRRQRAPSWPLRLMPPASGQSPSAFLIPNLFHTASAPGFLRSVLLRRCEANMDL